MCYSSGMKAMIDLLLVRNCGTRAKDRKPRFTARARLTEPLDYAILATFYQLRGWRWGTQLEHCVTALVRHTGTGGLERDNADRIWCAPIKVTQAMGDACLAAIADEAPYVPIPLTWRGLTRYVSIPINLLQMDA